MPVMNGIEATKEIRRMEREGLLSAVKPIIAVTANSSEGQLQQVSCAARVGNSGSGIWMWSDYSSPT